MTHYEQFEQDVLAVLAEFGLQSGYFAHGTLFYDMYEDSLDDIALIATLQEKFGDIEINESRGEIAIDFVAEGAEE